MSRCPFSPFGLVDRRGGLVVLGVGAGEPHVALLVDRVVEPLVGHRRHAHADLVDVRDTGTSPAAWTTRRRSTPRCRPEWSRHRGGCGRSPAPPAPAACWRARRSARRPPCARPGPSAPGCPCCPRSRRCIPGRRGAGTRGGCPPCTNRAPSGRPARRRRTSAPDTGGSGRSPCGLIIQPSRVEPSAIVTWKNSPGRVIASLTRAMSSVLAARVRSTVCFGRLTSSVGPGESKLDQLWKAYFASGEMVYR